MLRVTVRVARKVQPCTGYGCRPIAPGERYVEHTASPQHDDYGNTRWVHLAECQQCAERNGRRDLFDVHDKAGSHE